jgi:hypothetical protein
MKTYNFNGSEVTVKVITSICPNRIQLNGAVDGVPYAIATVNIPELINVEGYVAIKDYSENEGMLKFLIDNDFIEPPVTHVESGYVKLPICKIKI